MIISKNNSNNSATRKEKGALKMKLNITKLKIAMVKKKMNQNQLAKAADINKATLSLLMTSKQRGSIQTWEKIAKALDINVFDLTEED